MLRIYLIALILMLATVKLSALDYYWVNGSGAWSQFATHWAKIPNPTLPAHYHANVPTADDDVYFGDTNGGTAYTVNVDAGSTVPKCKNMDWTGVPAGTVWGGFGSRIEIYGSTTLDANMSITFNGSVRMTSFDASMKDVTSNMVHFGVETEFVGTAGGWNFVGDFYANGRVNHEGGLIETNGWKVTIGAEFYGSYYNTTGKLHLGSSEFIMSGGTAYFRYATANFNAGTSHIKLFGAGAGLVGADNMASEMSFYDVSCFASGNYLLWGHINGTITFYQFGSIYAHSAYVIPELNNVIFLQDGNIWNELNYHHLTFTAGKTYTIHNYAGSTNGTDQTILPGGSLTALGAGTCSQFITIKSGQYGTHFNFVNNSGAKQTVHCAILEDCHATGSDPLEVLDGVDLGNNTGWIFTLPNPGIDLYWVGGAGDWNDPAHWSDTDGGAPGTCIPNGGSNVHFTALSGFSPGDQVTVTTDAYCKDMDWTGVTGEPKLKFNFNVNLHIYGSMTLAPPAAMGLEYDYDTNFGSKIRFRGSGTHTVITAGQFLDHYTIFEGAGLYKYGDAFNSKGSIIHLNGQLMTMGFPVNIYWWEANYIQGGYYPNPNTEAWLGDPLGGTSSTITLQNIGYPGYGCQFNNEYAAGRFHAMNSHIIVQGGGGNRIQTIAAGVTHDYWKVTFPNGTFERGNVLDKLTFTSRGNIDVQGYIHEVDFYENAVIRGNHQFDIITIRGGYFYRILDYNGLGSTQTINAGGTINVLNASCERLAYLYTDGPTTTAKIAKIGGSLNLSYVILDNVLPDLTTGATYSATNSIGIQPQVTADWNIANAAPRNLYWVGNSGTWHDPAHWSLTSGGAGGECPPTPQDNARFDAASGLGAGSVVDVTQVWAFCKDMDWTGVTSGAKFYTVDPGYTPNQIAVFGSLTFAPGMVNDFAGDFWMRAKGAATITSAGKHFKHNINFWEGMGDWTFMDPVSVDWAIAHHFGILRTNNQPIEVVATWSSSNYDGSRELFLGSTILKVFGEGAVYGIAHTEMNYNAGKLHSGASHLILGNTLGGRLVADSDDFFYNVTFVGPNSDWQGGNILKKLVFEKTGSSIYGNGTAKEAEFHDDFAFHVSHTFNSVRFYPGKRYTFTAGTTQTILPHNGVEGQFIAQGLPGQYIEMKSSDPSVPATIHMDDYNGTSTCTKYLFLTGMTHTGTEDIYVPTPGGNVFNNAGWQFFPCNPCPASIPVLDATASRTVTCVPGTAVLVLAGLKADEWAIWYTDPAATTNIVYNGGQVGPAGNRFEPTITGPVTYYARVYSDGGLCESTVVLSVDITITAPPAAFNMTGGGTVCAGSNGTPVGLDGSDLGVTYELYLNGVSTGATQLGTGNSLSFGLQTVSGAYTIVATPTGTACPAQMNGSAIITGNPNQAPNVNADTNAPFCLGISNLFLTEAGGQAISWYWTGPSSFSSPDNNPVIVNPNQGNSGDYTVVITAANGCTNQETIAVSFYTKNPDIHGNISRPDCGIPVPDVTVDLTLGANLTDLSDAAGKYEFLDLECNSTYLITPSRDGSDRDGVTILDILAIRRHILGIDLLPSPYRIIEADVDRSNTITTFDMQEIQKLILGITDEFPASASWRFVPDDFVFSNPLNPFQDPIPENELYDPLLNDSISDFYAMKIGDVVGCGVPNDPATVKFLASDETISACGEWVDITVEDFDNVFGFQFSLNWDDSQIEYVDWEFPIGGAPLPGLTASSIGITKVAMGKFSIAWTNTFPIGSGNSLPDGTVLLRLKFRPVGNQSGPAILSFTDMPALRQVIDNNFQPHGLLHDDGLLDWAAPLSTMTCNNNVTVYLDQNCEATLKPTDVLDGGPYKCADQYLLEIDKFPPFGNGPWVAPNFDINDLGKTYYFNISDISNGNACWGNVMIKDNTPPFILCNDATVNCNIDPPNIIDCQPFNLNWNDVVIFNDPNASPTKMIDREWIAVDLDGNLSTCISRISILLPGPSSGVGCSLVEPVSSNSCDAVFDLNDAINCLTQGAANLVVRFFQDAGLTQEITMPTSFVSSSRNVFVQITDNNTGCFSITTLQLTAADLTPPIADCTAPLTLSIDQNCQYQLAANALDNGSFDHCGTLYFKARRQDANSCQANDRFYDALQFCSEDVGKTLKVTLRVYDIVVPAGETALNVGSGHYTDCETEISIVDKIKPSCIPPQDVVVNCADFDPSLFAYGVVAADDNCCAGNSLEIQDKSQFDELCKRGVIIRGFRVDDCSGNSSICSQKITVEYAQDFYIKFPDDVLAQSCNAQNNYGEPETHNVDCELIAVSPVDHINPLAPDACYIIERTWTIINWCNFDPNIPCTVVPNPRPNAINNHPSNLIGPIVSETGAAAPWSPSVVSVTPNAAPNDYSAFWNTPSGCYQYTQIIKVLDAQEPSINCPTAAPSFCDQSANDAQFWNETYWINPATNAPDLSEAAVNLGITATDDCSGSNLNIRYLLFLDLDQNGTLETVVNSANLPPANTVFYGNAFNPNYSGGIARQFDERLVSANEQYRFALQITDNAPELTAQVRWNNQAAPNTYINPELPMGTHKIKWIITDNCGNERVCEYTFDIKNAVGTAAIIHAISNKSYCHAANVPQINFSSDNPNLLYSWTNDNPGIGLPANGTGAIPSFTAQNNGNSTQMANIIVSAYDPNGQLCPAPAPVLFSITVSPIPVADQPNNIVVCSGQNVLEQFTCNVAGATFNWINDNAAIGLPSSGSGSGLNFTPVNNGTVPITATITVTPKTGDNDPPSVLCVNGLLVNIAQHGTISIWATDFLNNYYDDQTPFNLLKVSIRKSGTGNGFPLDPSGNPIPNIRFDCSELGTQNVEVWVMDECGNADYCQTYVLIKDDGNHCGNGGGKMVTGRVATETGEGVEDVIVSITGPGISQSVFTNNDGFYSFNGILPNQQYEICLTKNDNPLNGVTTADLNLLADHLDGTLPFSSPYKIIAADADGQNQLPDQADADLIRDLILGVITVLPAPSWKFVPSDVVFPNPGNPFASPFPLGCKMVWVPDDVAGLDFIGIKTADFNNDVVPFAKNSHESRGMGNTACATCEGQPVSFTITIYPDVRVNTVADQTHCNGANTNEINFVSNAPDMVYTWTNDNPGIGLPTNGSGPIPAFLTQNTGNAPQTANIVVNCQCINPNYCAQAQILQFSITVLPTPSVKKVADVLVCNGKNIGPIPFDSNVPGLNFTWKNDNPDIGLPRSGYGPISAFAPINNTGVPITATITVTPQFGDNIPPTVVCANGLSANIMPTGFFTLWAGDVLAYAQDNQTPSNLLKFSIRKSGTGTGFPLDQLGNPVPNVTFGCTELGAQMVEIWAMDECGNADFCETYIVIQNGNGVCNTGLGKSVSGRVVTEAGDGVEDVQVTITGPGISLSVFTNNDGFYVFNGLPPNQQYEICLEYNIDPLNGVTTFDLSLLSQHILGTNLFNSPYKIIAADADLQNLAPDNDDVETLRKLILGIITTTPAPSWRFVPADFVFPDPANPFGSPFPQGCTTIFITNDIIGEDFIGIKTGDFNNTAVANTFTTNTVKRKMSSNNCTICTGAPISFTITVLPCLTCPKDVVKNTMPAKCGAVVDYASALVAYQNPPWSTTLLSGLPSGSMFPTGDTYVSWQVSDGANLGATCSFKISVKDAELPKLTCPDNIHKWTTPGQCSATVFFALKNISDNCASVSASVVSTSHPAVGTPWPTGAYAVTYEATDAANNKAQCTFQVKISDGQAPNITCPANQTRNTDANLCTAIINYTAIVSDNCPGASWATINPAHNSGAAFPKGISTVALRTTDASGMTRTCSFRVTVNDRQPPVLANCPPNQTLPNNPGSCGALFSYAMPTLTDNCSPAGNVLMINGLPSGSLFPKGSTNVVFKATDAAGNFGFCTMKVTVTDSEKPKINCPPNSSQHTETGQCNAKITYVTPVATDNCPGVSTALLSGLASGSSFPLGNTLVRWRAMDWSGGSEVCEFVVAVADNQPPAIACPPNTTVNGSGTPCAYPANQLASATATDNCAITSLGSNAPPNLPQGSHSIVWTAKDPGNLSSNCTHTVTVQCGTGPGEQAGKGTLGLEIQPNPATSIAVIITSGLPPQGGSLVLYDVWGKMLWQSPVGAGQHAVEFDVKTLPSGVYLVRLSTEVDALVKVLVVKM